MKIIRIKNEWIQLLYETDCEVLFNKNEQRPYLYIPILVNNNEYAIQDTYYKNIISKFNYYEDF